MTHLTEKPDMLAVWISAARSCSVKDEGTDSTQSDTLSCSHANAPQASQSKWTGAALSGIADLRTPEKFSVCSSTCCSILLHTSSGATSSSAASSSSCHGQPRRAHRFQVLCLFHSMDPRSAHLPVALEALDEDLSRPGLDIGPVPTCHGRLGSLLHMTTAHRAHPTSDP